MSSWVCRFHSQTPMFEACVASFNRDDVCRNSSSVDRLCVTSVALHDTPIIEPCLLYTGRYRTWNQYRPPTSTISFSKEKGSPLRDCAKRALNFSIFSGTMYSRILTPFDTFLR